MGDTASAEGSGLMMQQPGVLGVSGSPGCCVSAGPQGAAQQHDACHCRASSDLDPELTALLPAEGLHFSSGDGGTSWLFSALAGFQGGMFRSFNRGSRSWEILRCSWFLP